MLIPKIYIAHPARLAALAAGRSKFDAGTPCINGHVSLRYCNSGACAECNLQRGNKWRKKPRRSGKQAKAANIAAVEKRREALARLPKAAAMQLNGYDHGFQARRHSKYLDSLLLKVT
jgi:hypothetical protein